MAMPFDNSRSRLLGSSDHVSLLRESLLAPPGTAPQTYKLKQLSNYFSNNIFLDDEWHSEEYLNMGNEEFHTGDDSWRLKGRMKTAGVALVVCLNIGVDPPDVVKPNPCARKECWFDPSANKVKGLEYIGSALQQQYEKWQAKAKFKVCLDPSSEDLRRTCINLRKSCKGDRLLMHYNGHGVPKPTKNGELWVFGKHHTHYTPVSVREMRSWLGDPTIYVLDCSGAGVLIPHLIENLGPADSLPVYEVEGETPASKSAFPHDSAVSFGSVTSPDSGSVVLAACKANEQLPFHPSYPADLFTSCLTTPTTIAIRWFIIQNPDSMRGVNPDIAETIPGKDNDRKSPRGELNWILTAITDTIAWNTLPAKMFKRMFRHDLLVASLFRNFLMAKRIMKSFNCTPQSYPSLPDSTTHSLWQSWDMALGSFLTQHVSLQNGSSLTHPLNNLSFNMPSNLSFFSDQLSAFEMWLEFGSATSPPPLQLPVVLQVLLSQSHRLQALQLLKRYLALGMEAVKVALILGIYPYIVKLLQNPAEETKQILISIWAAIIGFDATCRQELIREKSQVYFIQCMSSASISAHQRCLAAFVLAEVCNGSKDGQQSCMQLGLHRACTNCFSQDEVLKSSTLKLWICLALFKQCEDFLWAKYLCITEVGHTQIYPLLIDPDPTVRTAAVLALGELFGASTLAHAGSATPNFRQMQSSLSSSNSDGESARASGVEEKDLIEAELQLALQILECCTDGSAMVRLEAVYALSKFFVQPAHIDCVKIVAKAIFERFHEKKFGKVERRSASPAGEAPTYGKQPAYPWFLTPQESRSIAEQVEAFIEVRNEDWKEQQMPGGESLQHPGRKSLLQGQYDGDVAAISALSSSPSGTQENRKSAKAGEKSNGEPSLATLMASAYVRLWLALTEVEGKDPHALIAQAVATIRFRVHALIAIDEKERLHPRQPPGTSNSRNGGLTRQGSSNSNINSLMFSPDTPGNNLLNSSYFVDGTPSGPSMAPVAFPNWSTVNASPSVRGMNMMDQKMRMQFSGMNLSADPNVSSGPACDLPPTPGGMPQQDLTTSMPTPIQLGSGSMDPYYQPMSPIQGYGSPSRPKTIKFQGKLPLSSPSASSFTEPSMFDKEQVTMPQALSLNTSAILKNSLAMAANILGTPGNPSTAGGSQGSVGGGNATDRFAPTKNLFLELFKDYVGYTEDDLMICFSSNHYEVAKKKFLELTPHNCDPYSDPLSAESKQNEYRVLKLNEMLASERHLAYMFRDVEDRTNDMLYFERGKGKYGHEDSYHGMYAVSNGTKSPAPTIVPVSNICKFEQKGNTLPMDSPMTPSMVMFHAFQDVLVVAHDSTTEIWSTTTHTRIMEVKNKHVLRPQASNETNRSSLYRGSAQAPLLRDTSGGNPAATSNVSFAMNSGTSMTGGGRDLFMGTTGIVPSNSDIVAVSSNVSSRITAMAWINESYDALLLLGSDDGVVRVWRDISHSDFTQSNAYSMANNTISSISAANNASGTSSPPVGGSVSSVELATAFCALPDIDLASRGSGTVLSWQQSAGTLVAGGNSNTIRVWDLGREQNVRTFQTGHETCLTALATTTVSNRFSNSLLPPASHMLQPDIDSTPVTWTFAGFADGSVAVYDERVNTNGGRVHFSHTHSNWVSHAFLRADVPEVVIGSVRGTVKFWDMRTQRTYKTLEVQKSPLTALTVHPCAPIMATGSHAQFIKILTLGGEQIGNIIKYYDGFLGQRIGPVSSLTFHPSKLLLAASSTDGIVSLYHANS